MKKFTPLAYLILHLFVYAYFGICWIINLIQLIQCDWETPFKEEAIKAIGAFTGLGAGITVWY